MSNILADLAHNPPGGAAKTLEYANFTGYVSSNFSGATKDRLLAFINSTPDNKKLRLRLGVPVAVQATVDALLALPNTHPQREANGAWTATPAGSYQYDQLKSWLICIRMEEIFGITILAPQPYRAAAKGSNKNFSELFVLKHAQDNVQEAGAVAFQRFASAGPFAGEPAPPINQNMDSASFPSFRALVDNFIDNELIQTAHDVVLDMKATLVRSRQAVSTLQFITSYGYDVRTFSSNGRMVGGGPALANNIPPAAKQHVQFAFTYDIASGRPIVNHFMTPTGPDSPSPAGEWREIPYATISTRNPKCLAVPATNRPRIFYCLINLAERNDI
jgi:hypothetical protein